MMKWQRALQDRLVKPSTRRFIGEARRTPGYSFYDWLHGYVYARWPYLYIGIGTGEHPLAKCLGPIVTRLSSLIRSQKNGKILDGNPADHAEETPIAESERTTFAESYHGKVMPVAEAKKLVSVGEEIRLPDLEQVIPYRRARAIILKNPDHIVALECPCRSSRQEPCLPLDVCLIVGEPFASFVFEHHPNRSRWISQEQAVEILQAEHDRGHVHHAFFKDAMLDRFYAICNCCACCCGAMQSHRNGTPMLASSGYVAQVDEALCIGCETCQDTCQFGALSMPDWITVVDESACMGCGVCVDLCPQGALTLQREASKGEPLEIFALFAATAQHELIS